MQYFGAGVWFDFAPPIRYDKNGWQMHAGIYL